jgi:hypothetical protein
VLQVGRCSFAPLRARGSHQDGADKAAHAARRERRDGALPENGKFNSRETTFERV